MILSPNDEEVSSSKKHTQFKTRVPNHTLFQTKMVEVSLLTQARLMMYEISNCSLQVSSITKKEKNQAVEQES